MRAHKIIFSLSLFAIFGCASQPYPYHDSAGNDHNRAPASLGIPADATKDSTSSPVLSSIENQTQADYLFLKSEIDNVDAGQTDSLELLKQAYDLDKQSTTLMQKIAIEYYRKGQMVQAQHWVNRALALKPQAKELLLLSASLSMSVKDYDKAEWTYTQLIKKDPKDAEAQLYLGALMSEKKQYKRAREYFTKVIRLNSYEPEYLPYYYRARSAYESGQKNLVSEIKKDLTKCFELKPDYLEAVQTYASIVEKTEGKEAVFKFYIQYQKKYGNVVRIAEVLAQYYIEKDKYDEAYEQLEFIEANADDAIQTKLKMALILIDKKIFDRAMSKLEELNSLVPDSDKVKFYLAAVYEEMHKPDKAVETYLSIQSVSGHYDDSRIRAAYLMKKNGESKKAIDSLKDALDKRKDNVQIYFMLAQLFEDDKSFNDSIAVLLKAEERFAQNTQLQYYLGTLYDRIDQKEKMLKHMNLALKAEPENFQAMNYIAFSLAEMGENLSEAEQMALRAHSIQKEDPYILDTLGWVYYKKGQYPKAAEYLELAHRISPDVSVITEHLGDVYIKLKKEDKALNAYLKAKKFETDNDRVKVIEAKITSIDRSQSRVRTPASAEGNSP